MYKTQTRKSVGLDDLDQNLSEFFTLMITHYPKEDLFYSLKYLFLLNNSYTIWFWKSSEYWNVPNSGSSFNTTQVELSNTIVSLPIKRPAYIRHRQLVSMDALAIPHLKSML